MVRSFRADRAASRLDEEPTRNTAGAGRSGSGVALLLALAMLAAGCGGGTTESSAGASQGDQAGGTTRTEEARAERDGSSLSGRVDPEAERAMRRFTEAVNRGDARAVAAVFAPDARFDSVGRVYEGRDEIMDRFIVPEVIELGGRYEILDVRPGEENRAVFEYDFTAGSLEEHFTYDCLVEEGAIQDCVGRYAD